MHLATPDEGASATFEDNSSGAPIPACARFGRYLLCARLAHGGMASVYLAQHRADDGAGAFLRLVAIKTIHPHCADDPALVQMFLDEARLSARLSHPNIGTVTDFGEGSGTYYIAMEYLHGESLSTVLRRAFAREGLPRAVAARILGDAAQGLHAAHELTGSDGSNAEVVHRDVSPQNVFVLYDGVTRIVDFGIARFKDRLATRTQTGHLVGKLAYMAPEQLRHEPIDRRTDIFALGVVLWESTLGRRLFQRESTAATVAAALADRVPRPTSIDPDYPAALERVVMRALERDPDRRYATADQMARELLQFASRSEPPADSPEVADLMRALFADRITAREAMLREAALLVPPVATSGRGSTVAPPVPEAGARAAGPDEPPAVVTGDTGFATATSRDPAANPLRLGISRRGALLAATATCLVAAVVALWHARAPAPASVATHRAAAAPSLVARDSRPTLAPPPADPPVASPPAIVATAHARHAHRIARTAPAAAPPPAAERTGARALLRQHYE